MDLSLTILLLAAPIGAIDVIYFHIWKFRLYERSESVKEEITHLIRGLVVPTIIAILLLGYPTGLWYWTVAALFALDALNTLLDVTFEPSSRAPRTVPPTELAVHFIGTNMMGAAFAIFLIMGWNGRYDATDILPRTDSFLPDWLITVAAFGVVATFGNLIFETTLFLRAVAKRHAHVEAVGSE